MRRRVPDLRVVPLALTMASLDPMPPPDLPPSTSADAVYRAFCASAPQAAAAFAFKEQTREREEQRAAGHAWRLEAPQTIVEYDARLDLLKRDVAPVLAAWWRELVRADKISGGEGAHGHTQFLGRCTTTLCPALLTAPRGWWESKDSRLRTLDDDDVGTPTAETLFEVCANRNAILAPSGAAWLQVTSVGVNGRRWAIWAWVDLSQ
jgi:hypothetical protein